MIQIRVKELLKKQKKSKYWFIKNMEGGYQALSRIMDNETKGISFKTLEKMCDIFDCEIRRYCSKKERTKKR